MVFLKHKSVSISIPFGMAFEKHYCSKCGAQLKKEKTHRVVTPEDKDYYEYQSYGKFPRRNYNVYEYQFQCPNCKARISYDEQRKMEEIQKRQGTTVLSSEQVRDNYENSTKTLYKRRFVGAILFPIISNLILFTLIYFWGCERTLPRLAFLTILCVVLMGYSIWLSIKRFKGTGKLKMHHSYSYEKESQMKKLHAYASHNKHLVEQSEKCYCFHCKGVFNSSEIGSYLENEESALCPNCNVDAIIPDGIDDTIDESVIADMHDYWF